MGPMTAIGTTVTKTFTFSGRAGRSEYWWYFLLYTVVLLICGFLDTRMVISVVQQQGEQGISSLGLFDFKSTIAWIVMIPPTISLTVRRLRDAGFSGFWILLYFVPLGALALLIMHLLPSTGNASAHGSPVTRASVGTTGKPTTTDAHKRAMQGYALLFDKDKLPSQETKDARKAEISEYYRTQVLKSAPSA